MSLKLFVMRLEFFIVSHELKRFCHNANEEIHDEKDCDDVEQEEQGFRKPLGAHSVRNDIAVPLEVK